MKKSEQKKRDALAKSADRRREHLHLMRSAESKRRSRQRYHLDRMVNSVRPPDPVTNDERIKEQLRHNMEVLEALEREYDAEQAARRDVNLDLEAKGIHSLEDKMAFLRGQAGDLDQDPSPENMD